MDKILVKGCPLCSWISDIDDSVELIYPEDAKLVKDSEFIIIKCKYCSYPMVVYGEHLNEITNETWGRMLYKCRMLFGGNIYLKDTHKFCLDHWHIHQIRKF